MAKKSQGIDWLNPYHIDDDFIMVLMDAEKDGCLVDEKK